MYKINAGVTTSNTFGAYVPAVPLPFYVGWRLKNAECGVCHEVFKGKSAMSQYNGHYAYAHILGMTITPSLDIAAGIVPEIGKGAER